MGPATRYLLAIPGYLPPTLNRLLRSHWQARQRAVREAADLAAAYALACGVPRARGRRRAGFRFVAPGRAADPDARLKCILDGLVKAGLLVDDSPDWCELGGVASARGPRRTEVTLEDIA